MNVQGLQACQEYPGTAESFSLGLLYTACPALGENSHQHLPEAGQAST